MLSLSDPQLLSLFNQFFRDHEIQPIENEPLCSPLVTTLLKLAATWGWGNGVVMLRDGGSTLSAQLVPFSLLPTPVLFVFL